MNLHKRWLTACTALVFSLSFLVLPLSIGDKLAAAQTVLTMETSADEHGDNFFGASLLQVIIEDSSTDNVDDTIDVSIQVRDGTSALLSATTMTIDDTSDGSHRFELFVRNYSSPIEPQGLEGNTAIVFDIGGAGSDIEIGGVLDEGYTIQFAYKTLSKTITYDDQPSQTSVDRDNYGSDNVVFLSIMDQDGNADPTNRDVIVTQPSGADQFITMSGVSSVSDSTCTETGANTAEFECEWTISTVAGNGILVPTDFSDNSVVITVTDVSGYMFDDAAPAGQITAADTNVVDSNKQSGQSFEFITIDDADGEIGAISVISMSSELKLTLTDADRNLSSKSEDLIDATQGSFEPGDAIFNLESSGARGVVVYSDVVGGDLEAVPMAEDNDNSGIFVPDLANDELAITFLANGETATPNNGILELNAAQLNGDIVIAYIDPAGDDGTDVLASSITSELATAPGTIEVDPESVLPDDMVTVTFTDPDLNDNPRSIDIYTILFSGTSTSDAGTNEFAFFRGSHSIGNNASNALYATLELEINGDSAEFGSNELSLIVTETGLNTGVFKANTTLQDVMESLNPIPDLNNGDAVVFRYHDYMEDIESESTAQTIVSLFVIPESPIGIVALMASSFLALGGFMFWKRKSKPL